MYFRPRGSSGWRIAIWITSARWLDVDQDSGKFGGDWEIGGIDYPDPSAATFDWLLFMQPIGETPRWAALR